MTSTTSINLETTIEEVWPEVRKRHLYPELPEPRLGEDEGAASIQMRGKQIVLDRKTIQILSLSLPDETVVEALLDHAVSHHTVCPWDFETELELYAALKPSLLEGDLIKKTLEYFTDVVVDTHLVRSGKSNISNLYRNLETSGVRETIRALYQRIWGVDLGAEGEEEIVEKLSRIPYLDRSRWKESILSFASIVAPLIDRQSESGEGGMVGEHTMGQFSGDEIRKGIEKFADTGFYAFRAMVDDFREELRKSEILSEPGTGQGVGQPRAADILFYMNNASTYRLPVKTVPLQKDGALHPHSHSPWELGKPVQDIDVWTSFGKVLPGISQVWDRREGETHGTEEGTPDCIVIIDSSGSMANPCEKLSYAVLGAGCAADAYLARGQSVAVYNFSDATSGDREILDLTRDRQLVYTALCRYWGGGTSLDLADLGGLVRERSDIFIITDMQITNLRSVIGFLIDAHCRVTAVHVGRTQEAETFRSAVGESDNVCVYSVESVEDIPYIVLAEVEARFES